MRLTVHSRVTHATLILAGLFATTWLALLAAQPVHIPVFEFSREYTASYTRSLSGIKGQTIISQNDEISRIDIWARTHIPPGEYIRVNFQLRRSLRNDDEIASGIVVFDRSRRIWQVRLLLDPEIVAKGDFLYVRLESILSSPRTDLYFEYFGRDLYPDGALLELDRVEVPGQDLKFKLYRSPSFPKPLAWAEAAIVPALAAAKKASGPPGWVVGALVASLGAGGVAIVMVISVLAARMLTVRYRSEVAIALSLILLALVVAVMAGSEAPIGKLWVPLK